MVPIVGETRFCRLQRIFRGTTGTELIEWIIEAGAGG
jgi:hypothetical protein